MEAEERQAEDAAGGIQPPAPTRKLLAQGAEARVWEATFCGRPAIVKQRFSKKYRHPTLDAKLTATRLKQEVRSMLRARKLGVHAPAVYAVEVAAASITMERVAGRPLKRVLLSDGMDAAGAVPLLEELGRLLAALHDGGLVHGDLTTSNLLLRDDGQLVLIDFGLSYASALPEDRAVDLYVLERAFTATHAAQGGLFEHVLAAYRRTSRHWNATLKRFAEVRLRGRKRAMIG